MSTLQVDRLQFRDGTVMGAVVQVANYQTGTYATGTTNIPVDNTIPQNTEGVQYMSLSITPKNAANKLKITVCFFFTTNAASVTTVALFQDSTANALAASGSTPTNNTYTQNVTFIHYMTAGTTSATTFKVRAGTTGGNAVYFNGVSAAQLYGGVCSSSITIEEIQA